MAVVLKLPVFGKSRFSGAQCWKQPFAWIIPAVMVLKTIDIRDITYISSCYFNTRQPLIWKNSPVCSVEECWEFPQVSLLLSLKLNSLFLPECSCLRVFLKKNVSFVSDYFLNGFKNVSSLRNVLQKCRQTKRQSNIRQCFGQINGSIRKAQKWALVRPGNIYPVFH